ncbi:hypothetical protein BDN70DRAFT_878382 [Pholiota conissans]|uniref:Uncharacterized protein n=1 Tax=Pholiota conissans TaxID=109636 RepID=A0A9P6CUQ3_9AGAR|nr:hypothetical protein BDN70DRAFT_878382 [Pholiota conissans]
MSSSNCTGIEPNPDISGVGVRTAIYAQAILTLVQPILAILDGYISEDELIGLHELYLGILLPGCALLFSALIQDRTFGLSAYHATIVLYLSWINNTSAMIFFQFALIAQIQLDAERDFRRKVGVMWELMYKPLKSVAREGYAGNNQEILKAARSLAEGMRTALRTRLKKAKGLDRSKEVLEDVIQNLSAFLGAGTENHDELKMVVEATQERLQDSRLRKTLGIFEGDTRQWKVTTMVEGWVKKIRGGETVWTLLERDWTMATLASAHLILFSAVGVWLWVTIDRFGDCEHVTKLTKLVIVGIPIPVTSQALRIVSIVIYAICLLPFINIVVFGGLELVVVVGCQRLVAYFRNSSKSGSPDPEKLQETSSRTPGYSLPLFVALTFVLQTFFIVSTELTIHNNRHLLSQNSDSQESDWTFGQTLAIALTILPLLQVWKEVRKLKLEDFKRLFRGSQR